MTLPPLHPIDQPNGPGQRILTWIGLGAFLALWGTVRAWDLTREWLEMARIHRELYNDRP